MNLDYSNKKFILNNISRGYSAFNHRIKGLFSEFAGILIVIMSNIGGIFYGKCV